MQARKTQRRRHTKKLLSFRGTGGSWGPTCSWTTAARPGCQEPVPSYSAGAGQGPSFMRLPPHLSPTHAEAASWVAGTWLSASQTCWRSLGPEIHRILSAGQTSGPLRDRERRGWGETELRGQPSARPPFTRPSGSRVPLVTRDSGQGLTPPSPSLLKP